MLCLDVFEHVCFGKPASKIETVEAKDTAESKGNAPGPFLNLGTFEVAADEKAGDRGEHGAKHHADPRRATEQSPSVSRRAFNEIRYGRSHLAAMRDALSKPCHEQDDRSKNADALEGRRGCDDEASSGSDQHCKCEAFFSADLVCIKAKDEAAEWTGEKARRKDRECGKKRGRWVG